MVFPLGIALVMTRHDSSVDDLATCGISNISNIRALTVYIIYEISHVICFILIAYRKLENHWL